jgi:hypothetical protein
MGDLVGVLICTIAGSGCAGELKDNGASAAVLEPTDPSFSDDKLQTWRTATGTSPGCTPDVNQRHPIVR